MEGVSRAAKAAALGLTGISTRTVLKTPRTSPVAAQEDATRQQLLVWIDTAFNGGLVIPLDQIEALGLVKESSAEAILADGNRVELETYACFVDWFGTTLQTQVVANQGSYPLLGTMLLSRRKLVVDYERRIVGLE